MNEEKYIQLAEELIENKKTMVWKELFEMPLRHFDKINKIKGDIVECGVWRGGYSIFLAKLFSKKNIWVCDSFEGFQPLQEATYIFPGERHIPEYSQCNIGPLAISLEEVQENFKQYKLTSPRIHYLKGFVNDTLPNSNIEKISLLRIDVDSFSATMDVLENLYDKVQPGGYIIFDDLNLRESYSAVRYFLTQRNIPLIVNNPYTDEPYSLLNIVTNTNSGFHAGSYIVK